MDNQQAGAHGPESLGECRGLSYAELLQTHKALLSIAEFLSDIQPEVKSWYERTRSKHADKKWVEGLHECSTNLVPDFTEQEINKILHSAMRLCRHGVAAFQHGAADISPILEELERQMLGEVFEDEIRH